MTILVADDNLASRELMREVCPMLCSWICKCRFSTVSVWSANCEANRFRLSDLRHRAVGVGASEALARKCESIRMCDCNELPGERWFFELAQYVHLR